MTNHIPKRGPRILHGAGALMMKARDLGKKPLPTLAGPSKEDLAGVMRDVQLLVDKLEAVNHLVNAYRMQARTLPENDVIRRTFEQMLDSFDTVVNGKAATNGQG